MTDEEMTTIERALDRYIAHLTEHIEAEIAELDRARQLRTRAALELEPRRHDPRAEVVRSGDLLHVNTSMLQGWIERAGASHEAVMKVKEIYRIADGSKVVTVGFAAVP
jgi:vacuolar-type H+-ATPase subunit E/Vma4